MAGTTGLPAPRLAGSDRGKRVKAQDICKRSLALDKDFCSKARQHVYWGNFRDVLQFTRQFKGMRQLVVETNVQGWFLSDHTFKEVALDPEAVESETDVALSGCAEGGRA